MTRPGRFLVRGLGIATWCPRNWSVTWNMGGLFLTQLTWDNCQMTCKWLKLHCRNSAWILSWTISAASSRFWGDVSLTLWTNGKRQPWATNELRGRTLILVTLLFSLQMWHLRIVTLCMGMPWNGLWTILGQLVKWILCPLQATIILTLWVTMDNPTLPGKIGQIIRNPLVF